MIEVGRAFYIVCSSYVIFPFVARAVGATRVFSLDPTMGGIKQVQRIGQIPTFVAETMLNSQRQLPGP